MDELVPVSLRFDLVLGLLLAFTAFTGLIGGPLRAFLALVSALAAVALTVVLAPQAVPVLAELFPGGLARAIGAPLVLFLALAFVLAILVHAIARGSERPTWGGRIAGLLFGLLRGLVVAVFLVFILDRAVPRGSEPAWAQGSDMRPRLSVLARHIASSLPAGARAALDRLAPTAAP